MSDTLQTTFKIAFSWKKMFVFWCNCHRTLFLSVSLTTNQSWCWAVDKPLLEPMMTQCCVIRPQRVIRNKRFVQGDATRDLLISGDVPVIITLTMSPYIKAVHQDTDKVPLNWPISYANKEEVWTRNINEMKTSRSPLLPEVDKSCRATVPAALDKFLLEEYWWLPWAHKLDMSCVIKTHSGHFLNWSNIKSLWWLSPNPNIISEYLIHGHKETTKQWNKTHTDSLTHICGTRWRWVNPGVNMSFIYINSFSSSYHKCWPYDAIERMLF